MTFPFTRMRRMRSHPALREMARETRLDAERFIYPIFVVEGSNITEEIPSMPGQFRYSVDRLSQIADLCLSVGIDKLLLFGIPAKKDPVGSGAYAENGIVQKAFRFLAERYADLFLIGDVCMCEYTSHGHCGAIVNNDVDNDETLELLAKTAVSPVAAGAHMVAPSDMMDGRIAAIRQALDENDFMETPILSYAAKYASSFYGPFRDAAESAPQFGDRRGYQMDPCNAREALREIALDIEEGADMIMVKPALSFLDIVHAARQNFALPLAAYNVSGEYSMVKAAAKNGWIDERRVTLEILTSICRAGADVVLTYHALDAARWIKEDR
ncbi:MAG: porphobilinogen synthase [Planctomycetota bacterium]